MKKLILSVAAICLLTCVLCACAAFAADDFELWVGGTRVTESNCVGVGWSFDWDSYTLTLNNPTITGTNEHGDMIYCYGHDLTVDAGSGTVLKCPDGGYSVINVEGKYSLTIKGTLTAQTARWNAIISNKDLFIEGDVTAKVTDNDYTAVWARNNITVTGKLHAVGTNCAISNNEGNLILSGGECYFESTSAEDEAILISGNITIDCNVTAKCNNSCAIYAYNGDLTIKSGRVQINARGSEGRAIIGSNVTIEGGLVTATCERECIDASQKLTVTGGTVLAGTTNMSNDDYNAMEGKTVLISGGGVQATSAYGCGIYGWNGVTISGGMVKASGIGNEEAGICTQNGKLVIRNGVSKVTAEGTNGAAAVYAGEGIELGGRITITKPEGGAVYTNPNIDTCPQWMNYSVGVNNTPATEAVFEPDDSKREVTVVADPEEGGTVTGAGVYALNETVTVEAIERHEFNNCYQFVNWTVDGEPVYDGLIYSFHIEEDTELTAHFLRLYGVSFVDDDNSILLDMKDYPEGTKAEDIQQPDEPTKNPTAQYTYTFAGWEPELADVTEQVIYKATYDSTLNSYTVTFLDEDGAVLKEDVYEYGTPAEKIEQPDEPTKEPDAQYTYAFAGWDAEIAEVTGDATYKATYTKTLNRYKVTFVDEDGTTVLKETEYDYGTAAADIEKPDDPKKADDDKYTYTFSCWYPEIKDVTDDATYKAVYTCEDRKYTVEFLNEDGTVLQSGEMTYGSIPKFTGNKPEKPADAQYTYTFAGWEPDIEPVTGDASYKATYTSVVNKYTVRFVDDDGTLLQSFEIAYGETPEFTGRTPTKPDDDQYTYEFTGWEPAITAVTGDAEYKAVYAKAPAPTATPEPTATPTPEPTEAPTEAPTLAPTATPTPAPVAVESIRLSSESETLYLKKSGGGYVDLDVEITPANASVKSIKWKSNKPKAAAVDQEGFVVALKKRKAVVITVTVIDVYGNKFTAKCELTIKKDMTPVSKVKLDRKKITLKVGETFRPEVTIKPKTAYYDTITWKSSDPSVASVGKGGLIKARKKGTCTITATSRSGKKAKIKVKVQK